MSDDINNMINMILTQLAALAAGVTDGAVSITDYTVERMYDVINDGSDTVKNSPNNKFKLTLGYKVNFGN